MDPDHLRNAGPSASPAFNHNSPAPPLATPGVVFRALQTITVERTNHDSRHAVRQTIETRARGPGWPRILIFPEATCTNGTALINFKTGPFSPGQPVQPVICTFPHRHFHPAWISGTSGMRILYRLCCQFVNHCEVEFLPRYVPSDAEVASPHLFANNVRRVMAEAMRVPMTSHSYDDVRLQIHAARIGVPEVRPTLSAVVVVFLLL